MKIFSAYRQHREEGRWANVWDRADKLIHAQNYLDLPRGTLRFDTAASEFTDAMEGVAPDHLMHAAWELAGCGPSTAVDVARFIVHATAEIDRLILDHGVAYDPQNHEAAPTMPKLYR